MKAKKVLALTLALASLQLPAQTAMFPLGSVRLLPSRFQDNFKRDSAWMMSIPASSLLHSFQTTSGAFAGREGGYMTVRKLGGFNDAMYQLYAITHDERYPWVAAQRASSPSRPCTTPLPAASASTRSMTPTMRGT